jgi:hypothetical protein
MNFLYHLDGGDVAAAGCVIYWTSSCDIVGVKTDLSYSMTHPSV